MVENFSPPAGNPVFERVAILGTGLIGSSVARVARKTGAVRSIAICDSSPEVIKRARSLALGDEYFVAASQAVRAADLVMFCVPVGANAELAEEVQGVLENGAVVTDVGSVKGAVIAALKDRLPANVHFVPAHPVAGTEESGPESGFASLFANRWCILTPLPGADAGAIERVRRLWQNLGSNVEIMSAEHHDLVLAITSHLPHLIAYNIVGTAADLEVVTRSEVMKFAAGGFRDFTRIAASDPTMWRDVFLNNRDAVLEMLGRFTEDLTALQRMIRREDGNGLFDLFTRTRAIRRGIVEQGQETRAPDFGRRTNSDTAAPDRPVH